MTLSQMLIRNNTTHCGSDAQPANCSNVNKQLSTQDDWIGNVHGNIAYTNNDHNSVLYYKELCEGTIKSFSCTRCKMSFTSIEELTSHYATHKTTGTHQCNVCDKSFTWKEDLMRHLRIHSGERSYQSTVCDKRFTLKSHLILTTHPKDTQNTHLIKHLLAKHLLMHSGERPLKCNVRDKRFTSKDTSKHLRTYNYI